MKRNYPDTSDLSDSKTSDNSSERIGYGSERDWNRIPGNLRKDRIEVKLRYIMLRNLNCNF